MIAYYIKRIFQILENDGVKALFSQSKHFIKNKLLIEDILFTINCKKNKLINNFLFDSPVDPRSRIYIEANNIEYQNPVFSTTYSGLGNVKRGDWDKNNLTPILSVNKIHGLIQHFKYGEDWENTHYYKIVKNKTSYNNSNKLKNKLSNCDELYRNICENGYIRADRAKNTTDRLGYGKDLEILVNIDRNGTILHAGRGNHRLAIAIVLDIKIPVQVLARHKKWQELRDKIYNNELSEERETELRNHPDLQDILE